MYRDASFGMLRMFDWLLSRNLWEPFSMPESVASLTRTWSPSLRCLNLYVLVTVVQV